MFRKISKFFQGKKKSDKNKNEEITIDQQDKHENIKLEYKNENLVPAARVNAITRASSDDPEKKHKNKIAKPVKHSYSFAEIEVVDIEYYPEEKHKIPMVTPREEGKSFKEEVIKFLNKLSDEELKNFYGNNFQSALDILDNEDISDAQAARDTMSFLYNQKKVLDFIIGWSLDHIDTQVDYEKLKSFALDNYARYPIANQKIVDLFLERTDEEAKHLAIDLVHLDNNKLNQDIVYLLLGGTEFGE